MAKPWPNGITQIYRHRDETNSVDNHRDQEKVGFLGSYKISLVGYVRDQVREMLRQKGVEA